MEEVFPNVKDVLLLHKLAPHFRVALVEVIGLLPSAQSLLGTCENPLTTVATAHQVNFYDERCNTIL